MSTKGDRAAAKQARALLRAAGRSEDREAKRVADVARTLLAEEFDREVRVTKTERAEARALSVFAARGVTPDDARRMARAFGMSVSDFLAHVAKGAR